MSPRRASPGVGGAKSAGKAGPKPKLDESAQDQLELTESSRGLLPFAEYYPQSKTAPKVGPGKTLETFDDAQLAAIHRLYYSVGPGVSADQFAALCRKEPAFAGRTRPFGNTNLVELFRARRTHFPWAWKTRTFVASSHALVDRLLTSDKRTTYGQIVEALSAEHGPAFSHGQALRSGARKVWAARPSDYPFVSVLPRKDDGTYVLEAQGRAADIQYDTRGRLLVTPRLAERVMRFIDDPRFLYHFQVPDFVGLVGSEIPGFGENHVHRLAANGWTPTFEKARKVAMKRLCEQIQRLHRDEGMEHLNDVLDALEKRFGYPRFAPDQVGFFRSHYPELVPNFREGKIEARLEAADVLMRELLKNPDEPMRHIGRRLGWSDRQLVRVLHALRRHRPDELPPKSWSPWTEADRKELLEAVETCPIGTTQAQLLETLRADHPELMLRHDLSLPISVSMAIRTQLGITDWNVRQAQRFREAFVHLAERSPRGTSITELARTLLERHPGAYHPDYVLELARRWKDAPQQYPPIERLIDERGLFPWEYARVNFDQSLAREVGKLIRRHPGKSLREYAKLVRDDPELGARVPQFSADHIARLRVAHPAEVPYVDDLRSEGHRAWLMARRKETEALAKKAARIADKHPDPESLNVNSLAKALGVSYGKCRLALDRFPDLFPWYSPPSRGPGPDIHLATRIAHDMENAKVGTTLYDLALEIRRDPVFREAYPDFTVNSMQWLRAQYPDLIPDWSTRNQIMRSKLLVDALLRAPAGTAYKKVLAGLRAQHPGAFGPGFDRPEYVLRHWQAAPDRFSFAEVLKDRGQYRLSGRGKPGLVEKSSPNGELATRLARMGALPTTLPLLDAVADKMPKSAFSNVEVIAVQHLLDSQVPTFETYQKLGMAPGRTTVIGVPYSSSPIVGDVLADKGFDVRIPPLDMARWFEEVRQVMWEKVEAAQESGRRILFIDDGGLAAQILSHDPELSKHAHLFTIVEQTRRGITVAEGVDLHASVINVAQAPTKAVEGPMIGSSSEERLLRRLTGLGVDSLKGKKVGVIGHGVIGASIAAMLAKAGAEVTVMDRDDAVQKEAGRHYKTPSSRAAFFAAQDIILGSTGMNSITKDDLQHLKDGVILGSTSSKLVEIDVEAIEDESRPKPGRPPRRKIADEDNFPPGLAYTLRDGREIKLLASGYPINFDRGPEDVPAEHIQLTRALMLIGALQAVGTKAAGLHPLEAGRQLDALEVFESLGVAEGHEALLAAVGVARTQLGSVLDTRVRQAKR